jgi:hypothetical protein
LLVVRCRCYGGGDRGACVWSVLVLDESLNVLGDLFGFLCALFAFVVIFWLPLLEFHQNFWCMFQVWLGNPFVHVGYISLPSYEIFHLSPFSCYDPSQELIWDMKHCTSSNIDSDGEGLDMNEMAMLTEKRRKV